MRIRIKYHCVFFIIVFSILFSSLISSIIYEDTKISYKEVGYNNGSIDTKIDVIEKVRNSIGIIDVNSCNEMYMDDNSNIIPFIEVKTSSLSAVKYDNKLIGFCLKE